MIGPYLWNLTNIWLFLNSSMWTYINCNNFIFPYQHQTNIIILNWYNTLIKTSTWLENALITQFLFSNYRPLHLISVVFGLWLINRITEKGFLCLHIKDLDLFVMKSNYLDIIVIKADRPHPRDCRPLITNKHLRLVQPWEYWLTLPSTLSPSFAIDKERCLWAVFKILFILLYKTVLWWGNVLGICVMCFNQINWKNLN